MKLGIATTTKTELKRFSSFNIITSPYDCTFSPALATGEEGKRRGTNRKRQKEILA